ncbi:MAG: hypothetical protein MUF01_04665 [Bryobacterales bacterium]|nr:hypothetical protein [Bryobacterales bacterium]
MIRVDLPNKPWLAVQALGVLMMLHAGGLLLLVGDDPSRNRELLGWMFLSMGLFGVVVSYGARRWLGSPAIGWSGAIAFFASLILLALAPSGNLALSLTVSLAVLALGLAHWAGAIRLRRDEQRYRPYVCSGTVNILVSVMVMQTSEYPSAYTLSALVAGSTFTSGLTLIHYGRLLRRLATTGASMMNQLENTAVSHIRHSKARI